MLGERFRLSFILKDASEVNRPHVYVVLTVTEKLIAHCWD